MNEQELAKFLASVSDVIVDQQGIAVSCVEGDQVRIYEFDRATKTLTAEVL